MTESTSILFAKTEDLSAFTRDSIVQLCVEAHHEEDFKNLFIYVPWGGLHALLYRGEQLASHALVTTRWLQPEGLPVLRTAYVDAVATLPIHQGQGYGSMLMHQLANEIDNEYTIAGLETDRAEFYKKLGWQLWRGPLAGRSEQGLIPTPEQKGIMILVLSLTPALNLDSALTIECQSERIW